jgi:hypothetical protein
MSNEQRDSREPLNRTFNPEDIRVGDRVRLRDKVTEKPTGPVMRVQHVGGTYNNKVYCAEIGHELYATLFKRVGGAR